MTFNPQRRMKEGMNVEWMSLSIGIAMAGLRPSSNFKLCVQQHGASVTPNVNRGQLLFRHATSCSDDSIVVGVSPSDSSPPRQDQSTRLILNNKESKIVLPPRLCTLRAFGKNGDGIVRAEPDGMSSFFNSLVASVAHSTEIKDWEILSGRLAMIVFAAAVCVELLTGNSLFQKMDVQKICQIGGVCMASILSAAGFAWASRARSQVATIVSQRCNDFVDSLIDQLVDGLFYEDETN